MVELTEVQEQKLAMLGQLRRFEAGWKADRLKTVGAAAELVDAGLLDLSEVCAALEMSVPTWYRRRAELRAYLAGLGGAAATSAGDQAAAGAPRLPDPDEEGKS